MEDLKVDRTKIKTVKNYATMKGITVQAVYKMINEKRIETTDLDGVTFIRI